MSFLTGNVLGSCLCSGCAGVNTNEQQVVFGRVFYPLGYVRVYSIDEIDYATYYNAPDLRVDASRQYSPGASYPSAILNFPHQCYLKLQVDYINSGGNLVSRYEYEWDARDGLMKTTITDNSGSYSWDGEQYPSGTPKAVIYFTNGDDYLAQRYANGAVIELRMSNALTRSDAASLCDTLLAEVDLLDPVTTYTNAATGLPFHFAYSSEFGTGTYANCVMVQYSVTRDGSGNITAADPAINIFSEPLFGSEFNAYSYWETSGGNFTGKALTVCSKSAVRHMLEFDFRRDWFLDLATLVFPVTGFPIVGSPVVAYQLSPKLSPGEHLFDRSDCPDYGVSQWFNAGAMLPYPGAGNTGTGAGNTTGSGGYNEPL